MKKFMWTWIICASILTSLYGLFFYFIPLNPVPPGDYLWISLCALAVYFCENSDIKYFPNYICSTLAGLISGFSGIMLIGFLVGLGWNPAFAKCTILLIITFYTMSIHMILLKNTWLNKTPMIFATLSFVFSQNDQNLWQIALSILGGFLLGIAISKVKILLRNKMLPAKKNPLH